MLASLFGAQGDSEFGDAVGVDGTPSNVLGDAVDAAAAGESGLGRDGKVNRTDGGNDLRLADGEGLAGVHAARDKH